MAINHPYNPRHNAKIYIPKLTEEERRARATPLENLRSLHFRSQTPAASVEVSIPTESAPQDVPVPSQAPTLDYIPTALEVVSAEFPAIFHQKDNQPDLEVHEDEHEVLRAGCRANGHRWEYAHHHEANVAKAPDPPLRPGLRRGRYPRLRQCRFVL